MGMVQGEAIAMRFFNLLGAAAAGPHAFAPAPASEALTQTLGSKVGMKVQHFAESKLIIIWGSNVHHQQRAFLAHRARSQTPRCQVGVHRPAPHRNR
jgi:anaerobic selenocysteine-containing dehydrogenase